MVFRGKMFGAIIPAIILAGSLVPAMALSKAKIRVTTDGVRWAPETATPITAKATSATSVDIDTLTRYQTIDGFGGCFNELSWKALLTLSAASRDTVIRSLFDTVAGCKFNVCRMPIGASDYARDWYSLNENYNDTLMTKISIARDSGYLLQYIKAAMKYRPDLKMWASPWCPPKWMKDNNAYLNGGFITWTPTILNAYTLYLEKAIRLYRDQGLNLFALSFQNESKMRPNYPGCEWTQTQHRDFIKSYLGPRFTTSKLICEIWTPTMNCDDITYFDAMLADPYCAAKITTICYQWDGKNVIDAVNAKYPNKFKTYQTETECGDGTNLWSYAVDPTFRYMKYYFDRKANAYMQWNMVLEKGGWSGWNWQQNAMISIDTVTKKVVYNPQYYVAKHFSYYVKANAKKIKSSGSFADNVVFRNPDGSIIAVLSNSTTSAKTVAVSFGTQMINVSMPQNSFATAVIYDSVATGVVAGKNALHAGKCAVLASLTGSTITFSANGLPFEAQIIGVDGRIKTSISSVNGASRSIARSELSAGAYVLRAKVQNFSQESTLFLP
jgi:glucosylceramidase